jgi:L-alanine-DL-glutamate epimerase-like enolase superfamily enzyme
MKIAAIRLLRLEGHRTPAGWDDRAIRPLDLYPGHADDRNDEWITSSRVSHIYLEIQTDEGSSGWYGPIDARQASLIATELRGLLVGLDALATEWIHDQMLRLHRHGRSGMFVTAISAVDNALWDLRGKVAGQPVYRLLGGPTQDPVPAYASMLGFSVDPERAASAAQDHVARGFAAQKWFFRHGPSAGQDGMRENLAMAKAVRDAVGPGYHLMFDAVMGWDLTYATEMLKSLQTVEPFWLEEPVPPERLTAFRRLAASSSVRLATGEHVHTRWQVKELLDTGAVGIMQCDPDWAGGISEQRHICSLCSAYDIPVIAHGHTVPAALHLAGSQSPQTVTMIEYLVRVQEWTQHFQRVIYRPEAGVVRLPQAPGLGIDPDLSKIANQRELTFGT